MKHINTYKLFENENQDFVQKFKTALQILNFSVIKDLILSGKITPALHQDILNQGLIWMIKKESKEMVYFLIKHGADVNHHASDTGKTPLIVAADNSNFKMVDLLLELGADINKPSELGNNTALSQCMYHGRIDMALYLLEKGADPNIKNNIGSTFMDRLETTFTILGDNLKNKENQIKIISYYPKAIETFNKLHILHPDIEKEYPHYFTGLDLNLF